MNTNQQTQTTEDHPGLPLAYEFIIPSYQWLIARSEATHGRIQNLIGLAAAITVGAPVFGKAIRDTLSANSGWFFAAAAVFVAIMALGLVAGRMGKLILMSPGVLSTEEWLQLPEADFKRHALEYAGSHFDKSADSINRKAKILVAMTYLLLAEAVLLVVWISCGAGA